MISCKLVGGLGNQLFQIYTTIAYALQFSKPFFFLNNYQLGDGSNGTTIRYTYWDTFLTSLKPFLKELNTIPPLLFIKENSFNYKELPKTIENNKGKLLVGYFQSPKYFEKYKEAVYKLLKIDLKKQVVKKKSQIQFDNKHCFISMHFRFGDYKKYQNIYTILKEQYYINAIQLILKEINWKPELLTILYFCENDDITDVTNIINNLYLIFPYIHFEIANPLLEDWEQMVLMSLCNHNIIANSTFSWWGAYLNNNPEKIICYPEQWFSNISTKDTTDLFPEDWIKISLLTNKTINNNK